MRWTSAVNWDIAERGEFGGIHISRLQQFPEIKPMAGEKADVAILKAMSQNRIRTIFAENNLWTVLWVLLYWDQIFAKIPGSYEPLFGPFFPIQGHDIPQNLFQGNFYDSHRDFFKRRRSELEQTDLVTEILKGQQKSKHAWTRLLEDGDKFRPGEIEEALRMLPREGVLRVLDRLWMDYNENRRGLPDLLVLEPEIALVEVKGPKDRLTKKQAEWLRYLVIKCEIIGEVLVIGWTDKKLSNLERMLLGKKNQYNIKKQKRRLRQRKHPKRYQNLM